LDISKPKFELVEIKGAFAQANNFNQTIKVSPKAFKVTTFTSAYKKEVKYIQRNEKHNITTTH
jgi:hypothetical protein